jgi:hypothetical protein
MDCPFCGAGIHPEYEWMFACGTYEAHNYDMTPYWDRTKACMETQLAAQKEIIREMGEKIEDMPCDCKLRNYSSSSKMEFGGDGWPHHVDCKKYLIMKILNRPEVRKIMEEKGNETQT